jgi:hypothetical protein
LDQPRDAEDPCPKDKPLHGGRRARTNKGHAAEKLDNITQAQDAEKLDNIAPVQDAEQLSPMSPPEVKYQTEHLSPNGPTKCETFSRTNLTKWTNPR